MRIDLVTFNMIPANSVFACGIAEDRPGGLNMTGSSGKLLWVAKKGNANDWCIYAHWLGKGFNFVLTNGDKVRDENNILNVVPCTDDVLARYRM